MILNGLFVVFKVKKILSPMSLVFRPRTIIHIEDEPGWRNTVYDVLSDSHEITELMEGPLRQTESTTQIELGKNDLQKELVKTLDPEYKAEKPTALLI